jgi:hypothetical protein
LAEYLTGRKLFGPIPKILTPLRSIEAVEPDLVLGGPFQDCYGVTVCDSDNFAGNGLGVDTADYKDNI